MTPDDRKLFAAILTGFAELKGKQLSHAALDLYWNAMQGWNIGDFRTAANHLIRTCEFMPTPKDFEDLRRAAKQTAAEAWAQVLANVKGSQYRNGVTVGGIADDAVRAIGGYQAVGMCDIEKLHFLEKQFRDIYDGMDATHDTRKAVPQLVNGTLKRIMDEANKRAASGEARRLLDRDRSGADAARDEQSEMRGGLS